METKIRVNSIDGLRAIAMTMVIAQHCSLMPFGWTGVWLFFVISGFVITRSFSVQASGSSSRSAILLGFLRNRAIRIVPVYALYLLINSLIIFGDGSFEKFADLPYLAAFVYNWQMIFQFSPQSSSWVPFAHLWTLSVEQQFYLLFPLLILFVSPVLQFRLIVALIAAGPLLRLLAATLLAEYYSDEPGRLAFAMYASSILHFDAFILGSLLARAHQDPVLKARLNRYLVPTAIGVAVVYAAAYVSINWQGGARGTEMIRNVYSGITYGQHREVFVYLAVDLLAAASLWYACNVTAAGHVLNNRWLGWVGRVSYGGYLFHALILWYLESAFEFHFKSLPVFERISFFVSAWLLTVVVASISFVAFELPLAALWRRHRRGSNAQGASVDAMPV